MSIILLIQSFVGCLVVDRYILLLVKPNLVLELNEVTTEIAPLLILKSISKFSFSSRSVSNRILVQPAYFKTTGKKVLLYEWSGD